LGLPGTYPFACAGGVQERKGEKNERHTVPLFVENAQKKKKATGQIEGKRTCQRNRGTNLGEVKKRGGVKKIISGKLGRPKDVWEAISCRWGWGWG